MILLKISLDFEIAPYKYYYCFVTTKSEAIYPKHKHGDSIDLG